MTNYRSLQVWSRSKALVVRVYEVTGQFPDSEMFGLTAQMRRAALSVPANIAEGACRGHVVQFLRVALGSLGELETFLEVAQELGLIKCHTEIAAECSEISRMIHGLIKKYRSLNP